MAGSSLLVLIDDIASVLDDVATMTKVATRKTAGVLGDDLAVNAERVTGVRAERELPVVWAVAKGSLLNKAILVPAALLLSVLAPWLIPILLVLGGLFLCYEGFEKLAHRWLHAEDDEAGHRARKVCGEVTPEQIRALEKEKIRGAVRTDFILSAEIIVLTLGVVASMALLSKSLVLVSIALIMTVGVYGLVAGIVKLDDAGVLLQARTGQGAWPAFLRWFGGGLLAFAPWLMKALGVIGTIAMFMVGGGILLHSAHAVAALVDGWAEGVHAIAVVGPLLAALMPTLAAIALGCVAGAVVLGLVLGVQRLRGV